MNGIAWAHAGPTILAAFLASMVEFVEALTVILAVGSVRGWGATLLGAAAALATLTFIVAAFGAALTRIPLGLIQVGVGVLLLLFGLRWLRKAVLRAAGIIPLHDEAAIFVKRTDAMRGQPRTGGWDRIAFAAAFQITMLEGIEVVFIVIGIGAGGAGLMLPASLAAAAALLVVAALGLALHRPLARVPENSLKFTVAVLLCGFGTFWAGEGVGLKWPGADWSLLALVATYFAVALIAVKASKLRGSAPEPPLG